MLKVLITATRLLFLKQIFFIFFKISQYWKPSEHQENIIDDHNGKSRENDSLLLTEVLIKAPIDYKAVFDLLNATLGLGLLSMADIIRGYGALLGFLLLFVFACYNFFSGLLLLSVRKMCGKSSYEECADFCFGKTGRVILRILIIVSCLGLSVMFLVIGGYTFSR